MFVELTQFGVSMTYRAFTYQESSYRKLAGTIGLRSLVRWLGVMLALVVAGCAATPVPFQAIPYDAPTQAEREALPMQLVTGEALFDPPVHVSEAPEVDVLNMSEEMRAFVAEQVDGRRLSVARLRWLLQGLVDRGYFATTYEANLTQSAADTFDNQRGNCLSYTNMFVALAREAGLPAYYQLVDVPPSYDADSGWLLRNNHINVVIQGVRYASETDQFTIDFNVQAPDYSYDRHVVSDEFARALFYANLAVDALRAKQTRVAFAYLQKAMALEPRHSDFWVNVGAIYAHHGLPEPARQAYQQAVDLDASNKSGLKGLARAHEELGNFEMAARLNQKIRDDEQRNPFYHFARAQRAYEAASYVETIAAVDAAIELRPRTPRFHFLKSLAQYRLGDTKEAKRSIRMAQKYEKYKSRQNQYAEKFAALASG